MFLLLCSSFLLFLSSDRSITEALPQENMRWKVVLTECMPALVKTDRLP